MGDRLFCCWDVFCGADVEWGVFSWEVRDGLRGEGFGWFCFLLGRLIMVVFLGFVFGGAGTVAGWGCMMGALRSLFGAIEDWNFEFLGEFSARAIAVALRGDRGLEL